MRYRSRYRRGNTIKISILPSGMTHHARLCLLIRAKCQIQLLCTKILSPNNEHTLKINKLSTQMNNTAASIHKALKGGERYNHVPSQIK